VIIWFLYYIYVRSRNYEYEKDCVKGQFGDLPQIVKSQIVTTYLFTFLLNKNIRKKSTCNIFNIRFFPRAWSMTFRKVTLWVENHLHMSILISASTNPQSLQSMSKNKTCDKGSSWNHYDFLQNQPLKRFIANPAESRKKKKLLLSIEYTGCLIGILKTVY